MNFLALNNVTTNDNRINIGKKNEYPFFKIQVGASWTSDIYNTDYVYSDPAIGFSDPGVRIEE